MKTLGIDYGEKRIGIAISDESNSLAFPLGTILNLSEGKIAEEIKKIVEENKILKIVIGESKNSFGEDNPIMKKIRKFAEMIGRKTNLKIFFEPEFFTSTHAENIEIRRPDTKTTGFKSRRNKMKNKNLDASAAALILQRHLDRPKSD